MRVRSYQPGVDAVSERTNGESRLLEQLDIDSALLHGAHSELWLTQVFEVAPSEASRPHVGRCSIAGLSADECI